MSPASIDKGEEATKDPFGLNLKKDSDLPFYQRGHLVANRLGGPNVVWNLTPLQKNKNEKEMTSFEKRVGKALEAGSATKPVITYTATCTYPEKLTALEDCLVDEFGAEPGAAERLKKLGLRGNLSAKAIHEALGGREYLAEDALEDNDYVDIKRKLAYVLLASKIEIEIEEFRSHEDASFPESTVIYNRRGRTRPS